MLQERRGHSHAIWSNVPSSVQPSQMHMVEGRWGIRPPRAAGEKDLILIVITRQKICPRTLWGEKSTLFYPIVHYSKIASFHGSIWFHCSLPTRQCISTQPKGRMDMPVNVLLEVAMLGSRSISISWRWGHRTRSTVRKNGTVSKRESQRKTN